MASKICKLLEEMEKDEEKGMKEYDKLISLMSDKYPEEAGSLNINLGDEVSHAVKITNIRKKLKCK